jgi:Zn-finger nucleic acid-binding protein
MADQKDRLGDILDASEKAREDQWARQRDAEIIERLRQKYAKPIHCPQCGKNLDARVAIGVGGMACPDNHGAWGDDETLNQIAARLKNAAAIHHSALGEKISSGLAELVEKIRHPKEIDCPDCGTRLKAEAALTPGAEGLAGMACPNRHGAWLDQDMVAEIRKRLDAVLEIEKK